jgi:PadR family transcriptional regulator PadR
MQKPVERLERKNQKENLWVFILSLLKTKERYPFEIRDLVKEKFGFWVGNVTAYKVLHLLRRGGYVEEGRSEKTGGPTRRYYRITDNGRKELKAAVEFYRRQAKVLGK